MRLLYASSQMGHTYPALLLYSVWRSSFCEIGQGSRWWPVFREDNVNNYGLFSENASTAMPDVWKWCDVRLP